MNLFDPPIVARTRNAPTTLRSVAWSVSRGVLLGGGLAAMLFAMAWAGKLVEGVGDDSWFDMLPFFIPLVAFEFWIAAKSFGSNRLYALLSRTIAVVLMIGVAIYIFKLTAGWRLTDWAREQPEFITLVIVCAIVGLLMLRGGLRLWHKHRGRPALWFSAAAALWFSSEWGVKLGVVVDVWRDPRVDLALNTFIGAGILAAVGVLALMDWNIRRREAEDTVEGAPSEQNGLSNG